MDDLHIQSVNLITNNPRKIEKLQALGIALEGRTPSHIVPNEHNEQYLKVNLVRNIADEKTKEEKMNHMLNISTTSNERPLTQMPTSVTELHT